MTNIKKAKKQTNKQTKQKKQNKKTRYYTKVRALLVRSLLLGEGGSDLPKFKFSVEFPIGSHVILQLQILKNA